MVRAWHCLPMLAVLMQEKIMLASPSKSTLSLGVDILLHALSCEGGLLHRRHIDHAWQSAIRPLQDVVCWSLPTCCLQPFHGAIRHLQDVVCWSLPTCCLQPFHVRAVYSTEDTLIMHGRAPSDLFRMLCAGLFLHAACSPFM
ncbi:hypothetical protein P692DRAFT_201869358 [Suillus brevipes Sb2]|nr:hypothetical protein P692DRAFT_201869358 [Suillus brevipes Sb2]